MKEELLFQHIINNYNLKKEVSSFKICQLEQYPHIFKIEFHNRSLFIKLVDKNRIHCKDLNVLYSDLSNIDSVEKPILTKDNKYISLFKDKIVLLYEELKEITNNPDSIWWAKCLSSIHSISANNKYAVCFSNDFYNQTINLLNAAKELMNHEIKSKILKLFKETDVENIHLKSDMVLCHNDPYNLNVMSINGVYKLIDTDGMGMSPKEYDIQRLMWNHLINSNEVYNSLSFWNSFKNNYEPNITEQIDVDLLKKIYILDLVKTTSWLYIVSNDLSRKDTERQKEQLSLFERSFTNDNHAKILKKI